MRKSILFLTTAILAFTFSSCDQKSTSGVVADVELTNELDSVSYALGTNVGSQIKSMGVTEWNNDAFYKAFVDAMAGEELLIDPMNAGQTLDNYFRNLQQKQMEEMQAGAGDNLAEGLAFLETNKDKKGVVETPSGLQYEVMTMGTGPKPEATDMVSVHYHGTLLDGTVFDSSVERGQPAEFQLNQVIPGWTEGVQLMPVGSKFKFFIPSELAYGENPRPGGSIGPNMVLIFEIELLEIK